MRTALKFLIGFIIVALLTGLGIGIWLLTKDDEDDCGKALTLDDILNNTDEELCRMVYKKSKCVCDGGSCSDVSDCDLEFNPDKDTFCREIPNFTEDELCGSPLGSQMVNKMVNKIKRSMKSKRKR